VFRAGGARHFVDVLLWLAKSGTAYFYGYFGQAIGPGRVHMGTFLLEISLLARSEAVPDLGAENFQKIDCH
jgi:hypothetical protein